LRFRVRGWETLRAALGDRLPTGLPAAAESAVREEDACPEYTLDLGAPTKMDQWAPQIAAWRAEGVTWTEIVGRTGLDLNRAFIAWRRYTGARSAGPESA
jgi:hypothetical protein